MTATEAQIRDIARAGAAEIRERGFAQGAAVIQSLSNGRNGPCCTLTSMDVRHAAYDAVKVRIARIIGGDPRRVEEAIIEWNDAPSRTVDEALAVLERVAAGEGAP